MSTEKWVQGVNANSRHWVSVPGVVKGINAGNAERAALIVAAVNGYHTETEQSIAADSYWNIAETLGTKDGYSVQEHAEAAVEVLKACSDFLHDFDESSPEAVALAKRVRACLEGRLEETGEQS